MQFNYQGKRVCIDGFSESDWIYSKIKESHLFYEIDLLQYIQYVCRGNFSQRCILDIGANIGNHSIFFGMYSAKKIIAFEPNYKVAQVLLANLAKNFIDYKVYNLGIGDKETKATIVLPSEHINNIGGARLIEIRNRKDVSLESVTVVTLDSLLQEIEQFANGLDIAAIKIDIEGMEPAALRGGKGLLEKYKPDLFVEISSSDQMESVLSVLRPIGYRPIVAWAATPVWHFAHKDKLSITIIVKLQLYIFIHKRMKNYVNNIKRVFKVMLNGSYR